MASVVFNISKGRAIEFHERVNNNDPANSALIVVPLEASGIEADGTIVDHATLSALLAGTSNEQTGMGRKTLTDADIAAIATDNTNNRNDASIPAVTWTTPAAGNAISKVLFCYDSDTTAGTDANIIPVSMHDVTYTPDGSNSLTLSAAVYFRAS
jgi:hypothetical protein